MAIGRNGDCVVPFALLERAFVDGVHVRTAKLSSACEARLCCRLSHSCRFDTSV